MSDTVHVLTDLDKIENKTTDVIVALCFVSYHGHCQIVDGGLYNLDFILA